MENSNDGCRVNTKLLPFKFHFFSAFGAFAGVQPFMPVIAKHLNISAASVGIGFSMVPIFMSLSNPIFGLLVDYFRNIKVFLIILLTISCCAYSSVLGLPPIVHEDKSLDHVQIVLYDESEPSINVSMTFKKKCMEDILQREMECKVEFEKAIETDVNDTNIAAYLQSFFNVTLNVNDSESFRKRPSVRHWITFYDKDNSLSEMKDDNVRTVKSFKCSPSIHLCSVSIDVVSIFSTYQFWIFFMFIVIGETTLSSFINLSSVACYEILGPRIDSYGRQRLFGTLSWGIICSLAGIFNDILGSKSFTSGYYLMAVFLIVDIIILYFIDIPKAHVSTNICKDIRKIVSSKEILVFGLGIVFAGFFMNIIVVYEFWFLEDMGASQTLLGLSIAVQCLLGEAPFLFFTGWFVNKFGHFSCLVGVFGAFALRLFLYSILRNPWLVLPIEFFNGVTYGLYHGTMASFAKVKAPEGMEATLFGLFGGLYDGLGFFLGSFLCGIFVDQYGLRKIFFTTSMVSLGCLLLFSVASYNFRISTKLKKVSSREMERMVANE